MKRLGFIFLLLFILTGCLKSPDDILLKVLDEINLPQEVNSDITLPTEYRYKNNFISANWESSNLDIISNDGKVQKTKVKETVDLTVNLEFNGRYKQHTFTINVLPMDELELIEYAQSKVFLPSETKDNITLPRIIEGVNIYWSSDHPDVLNHIGNIGEINESSAVTLTAKFSYRLTSKTFDYKIVILPLTVEERLSKVMSDIHLPTETIYSNLDLKSIYPYGIKADFISSSIESLSNEGIVTLQNENKTVNLTLKLSLEGVEMTKEFSIKIGSKNEYFHSYTDRTNDFDKSKFTNLEVKTEHIVLTENALEGQYESDVITTPEFKSLIASWSAISGKTNTVEVLVRVRVGDTWSDYLSYQPWGLGLQNKAIDQTSKNNIAKLSFDELIINNNLKANAVQYKIILRRDTLDSDSPKLNLISLALEIPNYVFDINEDLPNLVDYNVPQLNQNLVPVIGNSICSPTSITMLLKYKGHSFSEFDEFEHRYIAGLARDYGHNIFGNWVYNTVTASAYGQTSYVKRMYSFKELQHHLHTVGPVAASVKGDMEGLYNTPGHLLVVRGYRVTPTATYVITNDPNLKNVYHEYKLETFLNVWRNIIYVVE